MAADLLAKWIPATGIAFPFSGAYQISSITDSGIERRIPSAEVGDDGELATDGLAAPLNIVVKGTLTPSDDSLDTLRAQLQALTGALSSRKEGLLYGHSDRFTVCRVTRFDPGEDDGRPVRSWSASFRASAYPFWQDGVEQSFNAAAGSIAYPAIGTVPPPVRLEITVSATGAPAGTINIAHPYGTATIRPSATGLYIIDGALGTVTRGGADAIADFSGNFPRVDTSAGSLVLTVASGATYSAATAYIRALYETL